jgi:hypothetical protein
MSCLTETAEIDPSGVQEWLDHNELGLAFDDLVDLGHDRELPLTFWQHLDMAAREMNLSLESHLSLCASVQVKRRFRVGRQ